MSDLDLTAAIEAGADAIARRGGSPGVNDPSWRVLAGYPDKLFNDAAAAIEAAAPLIAARALNDAADAVDMASEVDGAAELLASEFWAGWLRDRAVRIERGESSVSTAKAVDQ